MGSKCSGFRFYIERMFGSVEFNVTNEFGGNHQQYEISFSDPIFFSDYSLSPHACPSDKHFTIGTYFVAYRLAPEQALSGLAEFKIRADLFTPTPIDKASYCGTRHFGCLAADNSAIGIQQHTTTINNYN